MDPETRSILAAVKVPDFVPKQDLSQSANGGGLVLRMDNLSVGISLATKTAWRAGYDREGKEQSQGVPFTTAGIQAALDWCFNIKG